MRITDSHFSFFFVFSHSQDKTSPQCPFQTTKMQDGYSFMGMQGDTYAAHQDLGKFFFFSPSRHSSNNHFYLQVVRVVVYVVLVRCHFYFVILVIHVIMHHVMIIHIGYQPMNQCHPVCHHLKHVIYQII
jgi:hypothetical protein